MKEKTSNRESFVGDCRDSHIKANRSSLNNSLSKAMHRFPTEPRFPDLTKHQSNPPTAFAPPSALNPRATSLGYGNKTEIAPYFSPYTARTSHHHPISIILLLSFKRAPKKECLFGRGAATASQFRFSTRAPTLLPEPTRFQKSSIRT